MLTLQAAGRLESEIFLGIDLGTSALKTVLVDVNQSIVGTATIPLETAHPFAGWSEQAPADWWLALQAALAELRATAPKALHQVVAIGLSGQMHGLVCLDKSGQALRPAILWNDTRSIAESDALQTEFPELALHAGAGASPSFFPSKLAWLHRHEPQITTRIACVLPPKDYLRFRISGARQTDPCDAAGTLLLDVAERTWSHRMLERCNIAATQLPAIVEGSDAGARLDEGLAREWGIDPQRAETIVIAGGAGDSAAGAIGIGAIHAGDAYISLGTSAQIFVSTPSYRAISVPGIQSFPHALPDAWFQAAALINGASAVAWAARLLQYRDPGALIDAVEQQYTGPSRVAFLPYLAGERSPHNDPHASGVLFGCSLATDAQHVAQAALEGVAISLAGALAALARNGTPVREAAIIGGGARSAFWTQLIATVLGIPITRYVDAAAGPAYGAARLARLAYSGESAETVCATPAVMDRMVPDEAIHERYRSAIERNDRLYEALYTEFRT